MNINIPDKLSKLLVLVGIILIGYSYYNLDNVEKKYFYQVDKHNSLLDTSAILKFKLDNKLNILKKKSETLSQKYGVKNPITFNDSVTYFNRILTGKKESVLVSDTIAKFWESYSNNRFINELNDKKFEISKKNLISSEKLENQYLDDYDNLITVGFIILSLGTIIWAIEEPYQPKKIIKQSDKVYTFCQSCGKKFTSIRKYGTEKNSEMNYAFCLECYKKGEFTNPEITREDFLSQAKSSFKDETWIIRKIITARLKKLERWDLDKY